MGLNMYLYKRSYVKNWEHTPEEKRHEVTVKVDGEICSRIKPERIAYWRKFNALHGWIVANCANGVDECQEIYLSNDSIKNLIEILKEVKEIILKAEKTAKVFEDFTGRQYEEITYNCEDEINFIFPPCAGFYFGSLEIDNSFLKDVEKSIEVFQNCLDEEGSGEYIYQASW
jgi:hypothetical protein